MSMTGSFDALAIPISLGMPISPGVVAEDGAGGGGANPVVMSPANADAASMRVNTTTMLSCWRFFIFLLLKEKVIGCWELRNTRPSEDRY
jgi:hypothetical protein